MSLSVDRRRGGLGLGSRFERFVVVALQPFTPRNLERFGASWLLKRGRVVDFLDLSALVWGPTGVGREGPEGVTSVARPRGWEEVEVFVAAHAARALWILWVDANEDVRRLFELLQKYRVATLYFDNGRLPIPGRPVPGPRTTLHRWARYPKRLLGRPPASPAGPVEVELDYYVMSGRDCEVNPPGWLRRARTRVPAHTYDYILWDAAEPFPHPEPYAVFLDQALPEHGDFERLGVGNPFRREVYYRRIERFLAGASAAFGLPVIIALHPRSSQGAEGEPYRGFLALPDRTASLVKGAALVIAHDTTAISFAVLGRKPLLLVDYEGREQVLCNGLLERLAETLELPVAHMDGGGLPALRDIRVNARKYASYERNYVRHPRSKGVPVWDYVFGMSDK